MKYVYDIYCIINEGEAPHRLATTTNFDEAVEESTKYSSFAYIIASEERPTGVIETKLTKENFEDWQIKLERSIWKPTRKTSKVAAEVNDIEPIDSISAKVAAKHYEGYIDDLEWIDAMSRIPSFQKSEVFLGAVELQVRKYLDRPGKNEPRLQELKKARWYLNYMIAYVENGLKPIKAKEVKDLE
jgi:hypothetical protein